MIPGEWILSDEPIEINAGRRQLRLLVRNTGDRPVQVGSHFHFFEVNRALEFDRAAAFGQHLNIPAATALRFEPGDEREVKLVPYQGKRAVYGFNNLVDGTTAGKTAEPRKAKAIGLAAKRGSRERRHLSPVLIGVRGLCPESRPATSPRRRRHAPARHRRGGG